MTLSHFLVKKHQEEFEQYLLSSHHITFYTSSHCLGKIVTFLPKSGSVSNTLSFAHSVSRNTSKTLFNVKYFPEFTSPGTSSSFSSWWVSPLTSGSWLCWGPVCPSGGAHTALTSSVLKNSITLHSDSTSHVSLIISLLHFALGWSIHSFDELFL